MLIIERKRRRGVLFRFEGGGKARNPFASSCHAGMCSFYIGSFTCFFAGLARDLKIGQFFCVFFMNTFLLQMGSIQRRQEMGQVLGPMRILIWSDPSVEGPQKLGPSKY